MSARYPALFEAGEGTLRSMLSLGGHFLFNSISVAVPEPDISKWSRSQSMESAHAGSLGLKNFKKFLLIKVVFTKRN